MDMRDRILAETRRLALETGTVPSLNAVAAAAEVSKGGLIHHFPSRAALVHGLSLQAMTEVDDALAGAAGSGRVAETWLRLSMPGSIDADLFRALATAYRTVPTDEFDTIATAAAAADRWEAAIRDEVGDASLARVIRLVGDGLAMNAVAGMPVEIDPAALVDLLRRSLASAPADGAEASS